MSNPFVLRGGRVIDPANGVDDGRDVAVADGVFVAPERVPGADIIDVSGLVVAPGFIDMHVHLRDPGQVEKEDLISGTRAAAAGGFTTVLAMANTKPPIDTAARLEELLARARSHAAVHVLQAACLTVGGRGDMLVDGAALKYAGAMALTDDGTCIQDDATMAEALRMAHAIGLPVIEHCEDVGLAAGGVMHSGACAKRLGLPGKGRASEDAIIARDAALAAQTGHAVHIQHISSGHGVALVRAAQAKGICLSAEATPHHIALTDEAVAEYGSNAKMNPPLREDADRQAILAGLADGTIAVIATDHAPHTQAEKAAGMMTAPFGIIGLETAVPICLTHLYHAGVLSLPQLIAKFTVGPRTILGLAAGTLGLGHVADVTLLDPDAEVVVDVNTFYSRGRNCPYHGWALRGQALATIVAGRWAHRQNKS